MTLAASAGAATTGPESIVSVFHGELADAYWVSALPIPGSLLLNCTFVHAFARAGTSLPVAGSVSGGSDPTTGSFLLLFVDQYQSTNCFQPIVSSFTWLVITQWPVSFDAVFPDAPGSASLSGSFTGADSQTGRSVSLHFDVGWIGSNVTSQNSVFTTNLGTETIFQMTNSFIDGTVVATGTIQGLPGGPINLGPASFSRLLSFQRVVMVRS